MARVPISSKMRKSLLEKNAYSCCVCKRTGIGLNLHHIDGDNSNTTEENLAVLCVNEHDAHHRPSKYPSLNHLDLSADSLLEYKNDWERFVQECKKDKPRVFATVNAFGTYDNIVGVKVIFQWDTGEIVFERTYQQLDGDMDFWTDKILEEVLRFGKNIKIVIVNEPLKVEYCPHDKVAMSTILDSPAARRVIEDDWENKAAASIYVNPYQPSLAITIFYDNEEVYTLSIHRHKDEIHYMDYKGVRSEKAKMFQTRKYLKLYLEDLLQGWDIKSNRIFFGTGDPNNPTLTKELLLPAFWEKYR
ncbi:MAG: HNH endonuclease [Clostridiales bacterium]|nr:HNH endonuclease [Clostridiales bacterium]